jgi:hypothetical protein
MMANGQQGMTPEQVLAHQQQLGYPAHMVQHPSAQSYAQAIQAQAQAQIQAQAALMQQNGYRAMATNGRMPQLSQQQYVLQHQQQLGGQSDNVSGSPSTDSGMSAKRGPDPSPVEGATTKRAKVGTKRPSRYQHCCNIRPLGLMGSTRGSPTPSYRCRDQSGRAAYACAEFTQFPCPAHPATILPGEPPLTPPRPQGDTNRSSRPSLDRPLRRRSSTHLLRPLTPVSRSWHHQPL